MKCTSQPVPSEYTLITWINLCKCKKFESEKETREQLLYLFFAMEIAAKFFKLFYVPVKFEENSTRKHILCVALFLIEVEKNVKMYSSSVFSLFSMTTTGNHCHRPKWFTAKLTYFTRRVIVQVLYEQFFGFQRERQRQCEWVCAREGILKRK